MGSVHNLSVLWPSIEILFIALGTAYAKNKKRNSNYIYEFMRFVGVNCFFPKIF